MNIFVFISTALLLGASWLYVSPSKRDGQSGIVTIIMTAAAGLHTLLITFNLALRRPQNLFTRMGIPINTPVDSVKSLLTKEARFHIMRERGAVIVPPDMPKDIDTLLKRLGVQGSRDTYVRFGQRAMQTCPYCSSTTDYAILVLSGVLLDYLRTAALLLLITTHINGRQFGRTYALGLLTCAFLAEVYAFTSASAVPLEKDASTAFMWHDNLFLARNILFLVLPIIIQTQPAKYPPPPISATLVPALEGLLRSLSRAHLLKYFRQAVLRHPYTRERFVEFWTNNAAEGATARNDPNVQMTASKLGFGFSAQAGAGDKGGQESKLRERAREAVYSLRSSFMAPPIGSEVRQSVPAAIMPRLRVDSTDEANEIHVSRLSEA